MPETKYKIFLSILTISFGVLYFLPSDILALYSFSDDFDDGAADDWSVPRNSCWYNGQRAQWVVENNKYGIRINNSSCVTESIPFAISIPIDSPYSFHVEMTMAQTTNMDRNFVFKYKDSQNWYGIHTIGNDIYLQKVASGIEYFLPNWHTTYGFQDNNTYSFKVEVLQNEFRLFINNILITTVFDSSPTFQSSQAGLQASAGGISSSEVWFDNFLITELSPTTPPTATPVPTIGPFELPFNYTGRLGADQKQFKNGFWERLTAAFDHTLAVGIYRPFTGNTYSPADISTCTTGIGCYGSHNGTDFSNFGAQEAFSVSSGSVSYTSIHDAITCTPESTFGCIVIAKYSGNTYGLFAHLDKIFVNQGNSLNSGTQIGEIGATGCTGCGEHLHFGVLRPLKGIKNSLLLLLMTRKDWQGLLNNINSTDAAVYQPFCTYSAPNGTQFYFQDPSGWKGTGPDPWGQPKNKGGCGVNSPYLWKYDIGTSP